MSLRVNYRRRPLAITHRLGRSIRADRYDLAPNRIVPMLGVRLTTIRRLIRSTTGTHIIGIGNLPDLARAIVASVCQDSLIVQSL